MDTMVVAGIVIGLSSLLLVALVLWNMYKLKWSEEKSEGERVKDEALLASLGEGIVVTDRNGNIELINRQAEIMVGWKHSEVVGKKWSDIVPLVDEDGNLVPSEKRATQIVLKTGEKRANATYYYVCRDKSRFPVSTTASPVILEGKTIGVIAVFRDVTREKEIDRAKSEFVSLASHQLRTPLSAIKWFTEMLLSGDAGVVSGEQKEYLENVYQSNERMIDLVNSLLNISRIESGRIIIEPVPTDLGKLVRQVVDGLKLKIDEKKHTLAISVAEDLPLVNIDPKLVSQVYLNLLTNSVKYTNPGGKINIIISHKDKEVVSQISDNGLGIPKKDQDKMFSKFFRAENALKSETDGTGLGMYLARAIVESSKGKIWFTSEEGKGTAFWFTLPLSGITAKSGEVSLDS